MRYFTLLTRQKINHIAKKIKNNETISLSERILLSKYASKIPNISLMINKEFT